MARVKGDWLVKMPAAFTPAEAMAIGTAGYTAMLCVLALERHGVEPATRGPVLVTGAAGGVGSVAIALLAKLGYQVTASTGPAGGGRLPARASAPRRSSTAPSCPATRAGRSTRSAGPAPSTRSARHAGQRAEPMTKYGGAVAACGLAQGMDLPASVAPFILRGVDAARRRFRDGAAAAAPGGLGAAGPRPRPGQAGGDDDDGRPRRGPRGAEKSSPARCAAASWWRSADGDALPPRAARRRRRRWRRRPPAPSPGGRRGPSPSWCPSPPGSGTDAISASWPGCWSRSGASRW